MKITKFFTIAFFGLFAVIVISTLAFAQQTHFSISMEQRVAYQKALEQVYWKHMIWPASNPGAKPPLEAVMPDSVVRLKVEEYLRKSNALADWHRAIRAADLQAEMNRMAAETMDSGLLRELWAALGNDPYVIAECLARPLLVERYTQDLNGFDSWWKQNRGHMSVLNETSSNRYHLPQIKEETTNTLVERSAAAANSWKSIAKTGSPSGRFYHSAIWTGTQMIVWGGWNGTEFFNTGGLYTPSTNSWTPITNDGAPTPRIVHGAVWTGTEMIIWGGCCSGDTEFNTGGRYNPLTNTWIATQTTGAPSGREGSAFVWTGTELLVWGGYSDHYLRNGKRYNPSTDSWKSIKTHGAPSERWRPTAVWTGKEMIVWGGYKRTPNDVFTFNTGGRYNPSTNTWKRTTNNGAPSPRVFHTAVWTGTEMIIWGGAEDQTGGRYNPFTDSWTPTSIVHAPSFRGVPTGVWTGTEMVIWGGQGLNSVALKSGGRYNPITDSWNPTKLTGAPSPRYFHSAVWADNEMLIWGGHSLKKKTFKTGGRYTP